MYLIERFLCERKKSVTAASVGKDDVPTISGSQQKLEEKQPDGGMILLSKLSKVWDNVNNLTFDIWIQHLFHLMFIYNLASNKSQMYFNANG